MGETLHGGRSVDCGADMFFSVVLSVAFDSPFAVLTQVIKVVKLLVRGYAKVCCRKSKAKLFEGSNG